jgi:hypothetical protein
VAVGPGNLVLLALGLGRVFDLVRGLDGGAPAGSDGAPSKPVRFDVISCGRSASGVGCAVARRPHGAQRLGLSQFQQRETGACR